MISITESVTIARPAGEVFTFACDYRNDPLWRSGVVEMTLVPEGAPQGGTKTREVMRFMGQRMVTDAEVSRFEPGREIGFRATSGPIAAQGFRLVETEAAGARLTYHIEAEPEGLYRLFAPVMRWSFRKRLLGDLERVRRLIEARSPEAGGGA